MSLTLIHIPHLHFFATDNAKSIPELQQQQAAQAREDDSDDEGANGRAGQKRKRPHASDGADSDVEMGGSGATPSAAGSAPAASLDELRARLAARIESLRAGRKADDGEAQSNRSKKRERKEAHKNEKRKEAKKAAKAAKAAANGTAVEGEDAAAAPKPPAAKQPKLAHAAAAPTAPSADVDDDAVDDFSAFDFAFGASAAGGAGGGGASASGSGGAPGSKPAKGGKLGKLKHMLKEAQRRAEQVSGGKGGMAQAPSEVKIAAGFESALKRAEVSEASPLGMHRVTHLPFLAIISIASRPIASRCRSLS